MSEAMPIYPEQIEIKPLERTPHLTICVPGSKSITNRALILAALTQPERGCQLRGVLRSEDTEVMIEALQALGFRVTASWPEQTVHVCRPWSPYPIPAASADLFVGNSGTTMRFLTSMVGLGKGRYRLDGVARMRERPIEDLLAALRQLGVNAYCERHDGFPPVIVESDGLKGGSVIIRGDISSQFLSGLLMAAPLASESVSVAVAGSLVSQPYVAMTVKMMEEFEIKVQTDGSTYFEVPTECWYSTDCYDIEPDATAASYFLAAAAITGGEVTVPGLDICALQGDIGFVDVLEKMGCTLKFEDFGVMLTGGKLRGISADMNAISDTVMTLAAVACFAEGPTTIRNVAHIRHKETDRISALATELRRVGAEVDEFADGLKITPRPLHGATIETYNDHRMAMSMALIGLRVPGIVIRNPGCVAKTYPDFFTDLEQLRC
jgi:3-phosphoshikimate 1-carboxyvinyltransferase